jgi:hypothetical protein
MRRHLSVIRAYFFLMLAAWSRVALGHCCPRAPTDPDVLTLEHPVPQPTDWPSTNGPRGYSAEFR